ncbi:PREDICTED: TPD1 protein homolog 1 [Theobroma cacao]|uniref:TPD1 protein homolog 1 n=1 Tax=Theobroma cacao TaxID=3641 RepID=A0AB32VJS9_THECC|nr:PREDICTED: TPD1 protein homolog 1 [Theobroma cacao]
MAAILKSLFALVFLSLIGHGYCQCSLDNISVSQTKTGTTVQNKPEWQVTISNNCSCTQSELKLSCDGFQTVEKVDSSVMTQTRGECLINSGQQVARHSNLSFKYAWDTSFPLNPLSSQVNCS